MSGKEREERFLRGGRRDLVINFGEGEGRMEVLVIESPVYQ